MTVATRRWDGDSRGEGIADGGWIADDVRALLTTLGVPRWIAEDPDAHLLPHLQGACAEANSPWTLRGAELAEAVYVVSLDWARQPPRLGQLRADLFALLGTIAESATYVYQRVLEDTICYDVVTGILDDTPFRPHGHLVQFRIGGAAVRAICTTHRTPQLPSSAR